MFTSTELYLLNKLLKKVKYSEFDLYELNEFANSPITNDILGKISIPKLPHNENVGKFCFELDNHVGIAIKKRLEYLSDSSFSVISKWNREEIQKFALDILGPIDFEMEELEKLCNYLHELAKEKTCS
jgi:hypothetical protein